MKKKSFLIIILTLVLGFGLARGVLAAAFQTHQGVSSINGNELAGLAPVSLGEQIILEAESAAINPEPFTFQEINDPSAGLAGDLFDSVGRRFSPIPEATLATLTLHVNYAHDWVAGETGGSVSVVITLTDNIGSYKDGAVITSEEDGSFFFGCGEWDSGECPDIQPGDNLYATIPGAAAEIGPIGSITGVPDEVSDMVTGTLNVEELGDTLEVNCQVWGDPSSGVITTSANTDGGTFNCDFQGVWDLKRGENVAVFYFEPDDDMVSNFSIWPWVRVNYAHDWIGADYPAGHTFWYTVTESDGATVKGAGNAQTESRGGWNGDGFDSEFWEGEPPDIMAGDWVYFESEDGYTNKLKVGEVNGNLDVDNDSLTGTISAPFAYSLTVECHPWGAWEAGLGDVQVKNSWAEPDGSVPYSCQWNPFTEWDIQPGQDIAAMYIEPDDDLVINVFQEPAPDLGVWKWPVGGLGRPGGILVYGIQYANEGNAAGENALIVDTLPEWTSYAEDTSGLPVATGAGNVITWDLGTVPPGEYINFIVTLDIALGAPEGEGSIDPNCVSISTSTPGDMNTENDENCSEPVSVWEDEVEVGVYKWASPNDPFPSQEFDYHIGWCNNRGAAAGPVTLTDTLPAEVALLEWGEPEQEINFWNFISFDNDQLVLYAPGLPGDQCGSINLRVALNPDVPLDTAITNLVEIGLDEDVDPENNWFLDQNTFAGGLRYDLGIGKDVNNGILVPGGQVEYFIDFRNQGNLTTNVVVTDTLSEGLTFFDAWWGWGTPMEGGTMPVPIIDGNLVTWNFGELEVNGWRGFHLLVDVDDVGTLETMLDNCVEISADGPDVGPGDNSDCASVLINHEGPNLNVEKWHQWNYDGQLGYSIRFANIGDQPVNDVWISDTLPLGTTPAGGYEMEFDEERLSNYIEAGNAVAWNFSDIQPGESGWLYFNANLLEPGMPLRWYTNIVEITTHPQDANPADNYYEDLAFSGGELRRVEFWLNYEGSSSMWGEALPEYSITVTTESGQFYAFAGADPECDTCWQIDDAGPIQPGDVVTVTAGEGLQPVVVTIPNPVDVGVDPSVNQVYGQVGGWSERPLEVHGNWEDGYQEILTEANGEFWADYVYIPPGSDGYIRFIDEIDYAEVIYHRPFSDLNLVMEINYGHDWIQGYYEPGHTVWITVTESDGVTVKGMAELETGEVAWWEGNTGFATDWGGWIGEQPDLQAGDLVFGLVDNGYEAVVELGQITITVNTVDDVVDGAILADWNPSPIDAVCEIWVNEGPAIEFTTPPDGSPFQCDFGSLGWQIETGQTVAIAYHEPDGHRIINTYDFPQMSANIGPLSDGDRHVWGYRATPGSSIALTVTTEAGAHVASTVVQSDPDGNFNTENNFPEETLAFGNIIWVDFGGGITDTLQIFEMGGDANSDTDVVTVIASGPPFFSVGLEYCWLDECDWIEMGEIGEGGEVSIDLMAERGFDIGPGTNFHAHLSVWHGHEVIYSWGLPAPELGVWKWPQSGYASPGGVMVYGVHFRNDGTGPAEDVLIVDTLPPLTSYAGDTSGYSVSGLENTITWDVGTVEAGESVNFWVTLNVDSATPPGEAAIAPNCLTISTSTEGDWDPDNNDFCSDPVDVWEDEVDPAESPCSIGVNPNPGCISGIGSLRQLDGWCFTPLDCPVILVRTST